MVLVILKDHCRQQVQGFPLVRVDQGVQVVHLPGDQWHQSHPEVLWLPELLSFQFLLLLLLVLLLQYHQAESGQVPQQLKTSTVGMWRRR